MDPQRQFRQNPGCEARGKTGIGNIRIHSQKEHRYQCKRCGKTFSETKGTALYRLHKPAELYFLVMVLLSHGCPPQACVAAFGLDERTVAAWLHRSGSHCREVHEHLVAAQAVQLEHVQADELWVKMVGRKVWMAMAVCVPHRLWLGGVVSPNRDKRLVGDLARLVRACAAGPRVLVCTDGLSSYVNAFQRAWRQSVYTGKRGRPRLIAEEGLLMGQMVKQYIKHRVVGVNQRVVQGTQEAIQRVLEATGGGSGINTAYIERLNASFRARLAPLTRRTRGVARKQATLEAGMWLVGTSYNFCTPHHSLRVDSGSGSKRSERTPAMAAGLTEHIWTIEELLRYQVPLPDWVAPKRRGRPPKQSQQPTESLAA